MGGILFIVCVFLCVTLVAYSIVGLVALVAAGNWHIAALVITLVVLLIKRHEA